MNKLAGLIRYILAAIIVTAGICLKGGHALSSACLILSGILLAPASWNVLNNSRIKMNGGIKFALPAVLFLAAVATLPSGQKYVDSAFDIGSTKQALNRENALQDKGGTLAADAVMEVHFIDVGQGDAALIKCGDAALLIDAGDDTKGTAVQNYLNKQGITSLDYLILTHPDADHIGGAPVIISKFQIDKVFMSDYEKDNKTYRKLIQALDEKRLDWSTPAIGNSYPLGTALFTILAPAEGYSDPNNSSVAVLVENGSNRFLFTGDAEEEAEEAITNCGIDIQADVYQAGHHGSRTSSSVEFLQAVNPAYAVISCAEENTYGHPHAQTLNRFRERNMKVFRTDEQGSIIAVSDGKEITWNCAPSETWRAGEPTGSAAGNQPETQKPEQTQEITEEEEYVYGQDGQEPDAQARNIKETLQEPNAETVAETPQDSNTLTYVLNVKTKKFHRPGCSFLPTTNRSDSALSRDEIIAQGYVPCKKCNP